MADRQKILAGRRAVDAYRTAHTQLYSGGWHKGIPEEHTPLLDTMKAELVKRGFNTLQEFFDASEIMNIQELGFADRADFEGRAIQADREALETKWQ